MDEYAKLLIFAGIALILIGVVWNFAGKYLPLGKLPGDIVIDKPGFKAYFPIGTSIAISVVISLIYILYKIIFRG